MKQTNDKVAIETIINVLKNSMHRNLIVSYTPNDKAFDYFVGGEKLVHSEMEMMLNCFLKEFSATKEARIEELEKEVEKHKRIYGEIYDITDKQNFEV